jgi:hypothetical protein
MKDQIINQLLEQGYIQSKLDPNVYYQIRTTKRRYYIQIRQCACGKYFFTHKYIDRDYCSTECRSELRGRPVGKKLSVGEKLLIAETMVGRTHSDETKQKLSEASLENWKLLKDLN